MNIFRSRDRVATGDNVMTLNPGHTGVRKLSDRRPLQLFLHNIVLHPWPGAAGARLRQRGGKRVPKPDEGAGTQGKRVTLWLHALSHLI